MRPLTLMLLLLALWASQPAAAQTAGDTVFLRGLAIPVPGEVAGFSLIDKKVYDDEIHGTSVRYRSPGGMVVDLYLYPVPPLDGCSAGCDSVAVHDEAGRFSGMIPTLLERGYYESLAVETDQALQAEGAAGPLRGRYLRLRGTQKGSGVVSHFYLVGAGSFLLKARATHPPDPERAAEVDRLVRTFAREIRAQPRPGAVASRCPHGAADEGGIVLDVTRPESLPAVGVRVAEVLREHRYELDDGRSTPGKWITRPRFAGPPAEHPGIVLHLTAEPRGASTELSIGAYALCRLPAPAGEEDDGPELEAEMIAVTLVAGSLAKKEKP